MLWRLRTSAPWRDLPERYGPWQTVERFVRSETDGTWARLLEHVHIRDDAVGTVQWTVSVTINRVHQPAAGARRRGRLRGPFDGDGGHPYPCARRGGRGRPRTRPPRVVADKAYSSRAIRAWCRRHHIGIHILVSQRARGRTTARWRPQETGTRQPRTGAGRGYPPAHRVQGISSEIIYACPAR